MADWSKKTQSGEVTRQGQGQWLREEWASVPCAGGRVASQEDRKWDVLRARFGARKLGSAGLRITEDLNWIESQRSELRADGRGYRGYRLPACRAKPVGGHAKTRTKSSHFKSIVPAALPEVSRMKIQL